MSDRLSSLIDIVKHKVVHPSRIFTLKSQTTSSKDREMNFPGRAYPLALSLLYFISSKSLRRQVLSNQGSSGP